MWLYRLTNKETGKQYIGTSVNPVSHRISRHVYAAKSGNRSRMAITAAIIKYGIEKFTTELIGMASDYESLLRMEAGAIISNRTLAPNGYNITSGGRGGRRPCSQETKDRISSKTKGRVPWNAGIKTGPLTENHKCKLSKVHKGQKAWNKGIPHTDEHLQKLVGRKPWNLGMKLGPHARRIQTQNSEWSSKG